MWSAVKREGSLLISSRSIWGPTNNTRGLTIGGMHEGMQGMWKEHKTCQSSGMLCVASNTSKPSTPRCLSAWGGGVVVVACQAPSSQPTMPSIHFVSGLSPLPKGAWSTSDVEIWNTNWMGLGEALI